MALAAAHEVAGPILDDVDPVQLRSVQEGLMDPSLVLRAVRIPDGTIIDFVCEDANDAAAASLELARNLLIGAFLTEAIGDELAAFLLEQCVAVVKTGTPLVCDDLRIPGVNSEGDRHYDLRAVGVGDRVCFSWRELTDRFRSERELVESRDRFRLLAENSSDVVLLMTPDGVVEWVSPSVLEMFGWGTDELVGRSIYEFVHAEDRERLEAVRRHPATVKLAIEEVRYRCAGGSYLWVSARSREIIDDDGLFANIVVSLRDVNKQVLSRQALVASEERFRVLAENVSDVVYEAVDGCFVWVSPSVERVLGWQPSELIGKPSFSIIAPEDLPRAQQARAQVLGDVPLERFECRFLTASGERRWMSAHARRIDIGSNQATSLVAGLSDIHQEMTNRLALATLDSVNAVLVVMQSDEAILLADVCRTIIAGDEYATARYSRYTDESWRTLETVTEAPGGSGARRPEDTCWYTGPFAGDVSAGALISGETRIEHRTGEEPTIPPWAHHPDGSQYPSSIGLPIMVEGVLDGVLTIQAEVTCAFSAVVVSTLERLALQVGLALTRVRTRARLVETARERALLATAIEQAGESVMITDLDSVIVYVNPATSVTSGYSMDEIIGATPQLFASGLQGPDLHQEIADYLLAGRTWRGVVINRSKMGELYEEDTSITPVRGDDGEINGYVSVLRNISVQRKLEAELDRLRSDRESVVRAMSGVRIGATVEATAVSFCSAVTRLEDIDVARVLLVGGEGSVVPLGSTGPTYLDWHVGVPVSFDALPMILETTKAGAWWLALADIAPSVDNNSTLVGPLIDAGFVSIGFAPIWWEDHMTGVLVVASRTPEEERWMESRVSVIEEISSFARTVVGPQAHGRGEQSRLRDDIRTVIAERAFRPVFQPVVDLSTGSIHGYEALTRFESNRRPDLVFEEAHAVGLGVELETACAMEAVREADGLPDGGWLSVNLSPAAVIAGSLPAMAERAQRPVIVEITEHVEVESYSAVRTAVSKTPGVRISVDDAGAGYASLRHILELEPDFVKLDIGLVRNIDTDPARQALAAGLRHYADQTGNTLIAEGIETAGEHEVLDHLGIMLGQGFLFGRPADAAHWAAMGTVPQSVEDED